MTSALAEGTEGAGPPLLSQRSTAGTTRSKALARPESAGTGNRKIQMSAVCELPSVGVMLKLLQWTGTLSAYDTQGAVLSGNGSEQSRPALGNLLSKKSFFA